MYACATAAVAMMVEGGRLVAVLCLVFLLTETGLHVVSQLSGWCSVVQPIRSVPPPDVSVGGKKEVLNTITTYCLPKLICQLFALQSRDHITDSERNLIALIGSTGLSSVPSKYSYAAHMGQLVRGVEGQGCHNFYPNCPFSNNDVTEIAKRINFK